MSIPLCNQSDDRLYVIKLFLTTLWSPAWRGPRQAIVCFLSLSPTTGLLDLDPDLQLGQTPARPVVTRSFV